MPLDNDQRQLLENFREWIESTVETGGRFESVDRCDREDESTLSTRWDVGESVYYEVALRPFLPQVRIGILTDDRWKSEEFEQMIEDSGDTMQEFVELGFETAGLTWTDPPVEHYRDQGKYFYFATPVDLESLEQLADPAIRAKVRQMLDGYHLAFSGAAAG